MTNAPRTLPNKRMISKNLLLGAALAEGTAIFGFVVALLIIRFLG